MMLDRQLPHGGWNYGNTYVFGRELRPMPESTGAALTGLAGQVEVRSRSLEASTIYKEKLIGFIRRSLLGGPCWVLRRGICGRLTAWAG